MKEDRKIRYKVRSKDIDSKVETLIVTLRDLESGDYVKYFDTFDYEILSRELSTTKKDKKGKEIFEGDRVKHEKYLNETYVMVLEGEGFVLRTVKHDDYLLCDDWSELEVI